MRLTLVQLFPTNNPDFMLFLRRIAFATVCTLSVSVQGALYSSGTLNQTIPDGNANGLATTISVGGVESSLVSISVGLNISGGWNGDLYSYLSYDNQLVVLLNRPGRTANNAFGYSDSGFNITLGASGADIHMYQTVADYSAAIVNPGYAWAADGRKTDPLTVTDNADRNTSLLNFNGMNPNGKWTLFFADLSGGGTSRLDSWSLNIEAVPEPVTASLAVLGGIFVGVQAFRYLRSRKTAG